MKTTITITQTVLATTPGRWLELASRLPIDLLLRKPSPTEWSALECLGHLLDTERWVFPVRLQAFLDGKDFPAFDPDAQGALLEHVKEIGASSLAATFEQERNKSLLMFDALSVNDLQRKARHLELGVVTLEEMLNEWAAHDLMHTVQAERAMMQPFIQGSGPWQRYFQDHFIQV